MVPWDEHIDGIVQYALDNNIAEDVVMSVIKQEAIIYATSPRYVPFRYPYIAVPTKRPFLAFGGPDRPSVVYDMTTGHKWGQALDN